MTSRWADFLISKVNYDSNHLISSAIRHEETPNGIAFGTSVDRMTMASDIRNGLVYFTIYNGTDSWRKGQKIRAFSIEANPYLRIDENKVKSDFLGDLP